MKNPSTLQKEEKPAKGENASSKLRRKARLPLRLHLLKAAEALILVFALAIVFHTALYPTKSLFITVKGGFPPLARLAILFGADVNAYGPEGFTPFAETMLPGKIPFERFLIENGEPINPDEGERTPLHWAAYFGHPKVAKILIDHGAKVNAKNAAGWTPLHEAAFYGHVKVAKLLLSYGADVNATTKAGWPPLFVAASEQIIDLLLSHGATFKGFDVNSKDEYGWTPLHLAANFSHYEIARLLIQFGANVNARDPLGETPLFKAVRWGKSDIVELLLFSGADVNIKNENEETPLHIAVFRERAVIAEALIRAGADINAENNFSETPCDLARQLENQKLIKLLCRGMSEDAGKR